MVRRGERGFTLMEIVVALAVFAIFLAILSVMTAEMRSYDARLPVNFMTHPQVVAVISRLRKDVSDASEPYYPPGYESYAQGPTTLILYTLRQSGFAETVVYDFSVTGEVHRRAYSAGALSSEWVGRGLPRFIVTDYPLPNRPDSVRIKAIDERGLLAIDQIFQPRPHS